MEWTPPDGFDAPEWSVESHSREASMRKVRALAQIYTAGQLGL